MPCILFYNLFSVALGEKKLLKYMYDTYLSLYHSQLHYKVAAAAAQLRPDNVLSCSAVEFGCRPAGCGIISRNSGLFGITQSPELPKIIPTLRPLKVEIIFEVWDDFRALNRPLGAPKCFHKVLM